MFRDAVVLLTLTGVLLVVGFLLYLPFLLWFRHRRRRGKPVGEPLRYNGAGYMFVALYVAAIFGGLMAAKSAPGGWLGWCVRGDAGELRWAALVVVASGVVQMMARGAGIRFERGPLSDAAPPTLTFVERPDAGQGWTGERRIATILGVPFFMSVSAVTGGLLIACIAEASFVEAVAYSLSAIVLITVHELGHVAAARTQGLRVFSLHVSGGGGRMRGQLARDAGKAAVLYAGGLVAQAALLLVTLAVVWVTGVPRSPIGHSVYITFTVANLALAGINLVPGKGRNGIWTDGAILWGLLLHRVAGRPHPLAELYARWRVFPPETRLVSVEGLLPEGFRVGIELLADDATPPEFVFEVLGRHLALEPAAAVAAANEILRRGGRLFPLGDRDQAESVAAAITRDALAHGHPLVCRAAEMPAS